MDQRQGGKIDNWLDCIFSCDHRNNNCEYCKYRLCIVSTAIVLITGLVTLILDYYLFPGE